MTTIDCTKAVTEYVSKEDWRIKANANVGYSHGRIIVTGKQIGRAHV